MRVKRLSCLVGALAAAPEAGAGALPVPVPVPVPAPVAPVVLAPVAAFWAKPWPDIANRAAPIRATKRRMRKREEAYLENPYRRMGRFLFSRRGEKRWEHSLAVTGGWSRSRCTPGSVRGPGAGRLSVQTQGSHRLVARRACPRPETGLCRRERSRGAGPVPFWLLPIADFQLPI